MTGERKVEKARIKTPLNTASKNSGILHETLTSYLTVERVTKSYSPDIKPGKLPEKQRTQQR
jgi:hypothetical protein